MFLSQLFVIVLIIFGCFWKIHLSNFSEEPTVWVVILCSAAAYVSTSLRLWTSYKLVSTKNLFLILLVGPSERRKSQLFYNWLEIGHFQQKFDKNYFFYQHSQPLHDVMQNETDNVEFVQSINFEFKNSLKNTDIKYLLAFDNSCAETCNSNAFVDTATAGGHCGLSNVLIFTLSLTCFIKASLGKTLNSKTRTLFLSKLHVRWCKSARLVHGWASDQI